MVRWLGIVADHDGRNRADSSGTGSNRSRSGGIACNAPGQSATNPTPASCRVCGRRTMIRDEGK